MPKFSWHALERLWQYNLTQEEVATVIRNSAPFRYYHQGRWKTGYYDSNRQILVAMADDEIATIVIGVSPAYVERLKGKRS